MVLFVVWTIWIGFIVHKWRLADAFSSDLPANLTASDGCDVDSSKPPRKTCFSIVMLHFWTLLSHNVAMQGIF